MIVQKYKRGLVSLLLAVVVALAGMSVLAAPLANADAAPPKCYYNPTGTPGEGSLRRCEELSPVHDFRPGNCYEVMGYMPGVSVTRVDCSDARFQPDCSQRPMTPENCRIIYYLQLFINILSAVVGIVAVIMLVVGGIQYSAARDNPQLAAAARTRIAQTVLAVVFYFFIYIFLQWLVPGGVL